MAIPGSPKHHPNLENAYRMVPLLPKLMVKEDDTNKPIKQEFRLREYKCGERGSSLGEGKPGLPNYKHKQAPPYPFPLFPQSTSRVPPSNCCIWLNRDCSVQTANDLDLSELMLNCLCPACQSTCFGMCRSTVTLRQL